MMKLFIQIPCFNEEDTLAETIAALPRRIDGVDEIRTLVIDDGSSDRTIETAKRLGIDYIVVNPRNMGLAKTFAAGMDACLHLGADVIVNTDGDNQYRGEGICTLVEPIVLNRCDIVVGCRDIVNHQEFSGTKKFLQVLGSKVVSRLAKLNVPDVTSGFRAFSRRAAMRLCMYSRFSYTLETLIQAGRSNLQVECVASEVNGKRRESRLAKSVRQFVSMQAKTILHVYLVYCPAQFFAALALASMAVSLACAYRVGGFLWFVAPELQKFKTGTGLLLAVSALFGLIFAISSVAGVVIGRLRMLLEENRYMSRALLLNHGLPLSPVALYRSTTPGRWMTSAVGGGSADGYEREEFHA